jgi:ferredoxin-nitrite reductase
MEIADYLEARVNLDVPVNIHLTGCHHSCAQHYIGDIGLIATKVLVGDDEHEGYHIFVGGGYGDEQGIGREVFRDVIATDAPATIEKMLLAYLHDRVSPDESFLRYVRRFPIDQLVERCSAQNTTASRDGR